MHCHNCEKEMVSSWNCWRCEQCKNKIPKIEMEKEIMKEIFKIEANTPLALALLNNVEAQKQLLFQIKEMRINIAGEIFRSFLVQDEIEDYIEIRNGKNNGKNN